MVWGAMRMRTTPLWIAGINRRAKAKAGVSHASRLAAKAAEKAEKCQCKSCVHTGFVASMGSCFAQREQKCEGRRLVSSVSSLPQGVGHPRSSSQKAGNFCTSHFTCLTFLRATG